MNYKKEDNGIQSYLIDVGEGRVVGVNGVAVVSNETVKNDKSVENNTKPVS